MFNDWVLLVLFTKNLVLIVLFLVLNANAFGITMIATMKEFNAKIIVTVVFHYFYVLSPIVLFAFIIKILIQD